MGSGKLGDSGMVALTAKIMMAVIMFLFLVVVFIFFLHIYVKFFCSSRQEDDGTRRRRRRRRFDFAGGYQEMNALGRGLDPSILKTIPIVPFNTKDFKDGLECSVCLSEVIEGEKTRLLPKCNHGFHVDCIDMWFQSHSTCPLCRNTVELNSETIRVEETTTTTNTSSASTSNRPDGILVIDIPRQNNTVGEEEEKIQTPTRLRSLTRILSRVNPCSPRNVDVEQGQS